jgi:organic hydroperoxide reductase OsmC/OhrA
MNVMREAWHDERAHTREHPSASAARCRANVKTFIPSNLKGKIMTEVAEVLYLAKDRTTGSWDHGSARRSDGRVDVKHSTLGRNAFPADPEQSFAAGWSASLDRASGLAALKFKVAMSDNTAIDASVDLHIIDGECFLYARLTAIIADAPPELARVLGSMTSHGGPYANAIRGNIDVTIDLV